VATAEIRFTAFTSVVNCSCTISRTSIPPLSHGHSVGRLDSGRPRQRFRFRLDMNHQKGTAEQNKRIVSKPRSRAVTEAR
jgi:hypothetical protein